MKLEPQNDAAFYAAAKRYWHPVARAKDLPGDRPLAVELLGEELVIFRAADGSVGALEDLCSHRGTRLSLGTVTADGCVVCPYHAWEFAADGRCTKIPQAPDRPIPARTAVAHFGAEEFAGLIWVNLSPAEDRAAAKPALPEEQFPGWRLYAGDPIDWACQAGRQVENFLDIAHFSVLHVDTFGNADAQKMEDYDVATSADGSEITASYNNYPAYLAFAQGGERMSVPLSFGYKVTLPFTVRLDTLSAGGNQVLLSTCSPVSATRSRLFWVMAMPEDFPMPDETIEMGERAIFLPDRAVIESQRPVRLPIDVMTEIHLPFDKLAVAYRRALAKAGFPAM